MAVQRAALDPDVTSFEATVDDVDDVGVYLDETYFYAESGGQPADRGWIDGMQVTDVQLTGDGIVHVLDRPQRLSVGDSVAATIDDAFRAWCRCAHSASHVLYGAGRRRFDELGYGGFDIGSEKGRIDLRTASPVTDEDVRELERLANRAVWDRRPITCEIVSAQEAMRRGDVAFNRRTTETTMGSDDTVRLVEIGAPTVDPAARGGDPWDVAACGGTHVETTREIGPIAVLSRSNPGEGLTRIEYTVGPLAVQRWAELRTAAEAAAERLSVPIDGIPEAVERLQTSLEEVTASRDRFANAVLEHELDRIRSNRFERDGRDWMVGTVSIADSDSLASGARSLLAAGAEAVVLVGDGDPPAACAACGEGIDARAIIDSLTAEFGGGGGGGADVAQGGGFGADAEAIVEFLRTESGEFLED